MLLNLGDLVPCYDTLLLDGNMLHVSSSSRFVVFLDYLVDSAGPFVVGMGVEMSVAHIPGTVEWACSTDSASKGPFAIGMP